MFQSATLKGIRKGFSSKQCRDVVIVAAKRTPVGSFMGKLSKLSAPKLGSIAIKGAMDSIDLNPTHIEESYMGNVISAGVGQAPARQATLGAGIGKEVPCTTVNKVCASGMKSVMMAAQNISCGGADVMVAGGMESMSNIPHYVMGYRRGVLYGNAQLLDGLAHDGLTDVYNGCAMGVCTEKVASELEITRELQDEFALNSYERYFAAAESGKFAEEIVPVTIKGRKGDEIVDSDEEPHKLLKDKVPTLRPAFKKDGTVTAANASKINDGAAALIVMSSEKAKALGYEPLARIVDYTDAATDPMDFGIAPKFAVEKLYKRAGITENDVAFHENNEAFAAVSLANMKLLNISPDKINVHGGAVAMGHPIGASGARIIISLMNVLKSNNGSLGVASICNGGGGASAILIERLN